MLAGAAVAAATVLAFASGRPHHPNPLPTTRASDATRARIAVVAARFATAMSTPATRDSTAAARFRDLAIPALARSLGAARSAAPSRVVRVSTVAVPTLAPPVALVTATVQFESAGPPVPVAWTLTFRLTPGGWRVATVTS
jgi:hypothetical protein